VLAMLPTTPSTVLHKVQFRIFQKHLYKSIELIKACGEVLIKINLASFVDALLICIEDAPRNTSSYGHWSIG
jgi:hypothetical protein